MTRRSPRSLGEWTLYLAAVQAVLLVAILLSAIWLAEASHSVADSTQNLEDCRSLVSSISSLRERSDVARAEPTDPLIDNSRIIEIAAAAGIKENQIASIDYLESRLVEGTDYETRETRVQIEPATMKQLVRFSLLSEEAGGFQKVTGISLRAPIRGRNATNLPATETWRAELTLTRLGFVARSPTK